MRAHRMNVRVYNMRHHVRGYIRNLVDSTKNAAKLLGASVASCIHGVFPTMFKYTALAVCLSMVENDLMQNRVPNPVLDSRTDSHMHDI
jgi:hypothetical protein